jgi:hypothetical protein
MCSPYHARILTQDYGNFKAIVLGEDADGYWACEADGGLDYWPHRLVTVYRIRPATVKTVVFLTACFTVTPDLLTILNHKGPTHGS